MSSPLRRLLLIGSGGRIVPARPLSRTPRVSVVIPCYNYGRYLPCAVASALERQPCVEVEVVIVDDRSTDDSAIVARSLQRGDDRIRLILHDVNKGHIATYNDGLEAATGEFVTLLSADDVLTPGALTRAASLMAALPKVGIVYAGVIPFRDELPPCRGDTRHWIVWPGVDWLRLRCRSGYNVVASPEVMMRTDLIRSFGGYRPDLPHAGDFEMWLRTSAVADVGYLVDTDQAYYRQHAANMNVRTFNSGTARGQLVDLRQRWKSFETVFGGVGSSLHCADALFEIARRTMSRQAIRYINYAYARGLRDFPSVEFEALAKEIRSDIARTPIGRALARRKQLGMMPLPLHPLWAPSAVAWRLEEIVRRWRRRTIGI